MLHSVSDPDPDANLNPGPYFFLYSDLNPDPDANDPDPDPRGGVQKQVKKFFFIRLRKTFFVFLPSVLVNYFCLPCFLFL